MASSPKRALTASAARTAAAQPGRSGPRRSCTGAPARSCRLETATPTRRTGVRSSRSLASRSAATSCRSVSVSVASGRVRALVMVRKLAKRSLRVTVRPASPDSRSRRPTRTQQRSTSRASRSGSSMSLAKVSSEPTDLAASNGTTGRSSRPQASSCRWEPSAGPRARSRVARGVAATSPTVRSP